MIKKEKILERPVTGFSGINKSPPRLDAEDKASGRAVYGDDLEMPGMLFSRQVYSIYPHARLVSIDTSSALRCPGVVTAVTYRDIPGEHSYGNVIKDQRPLADDKVRFMGDVVCVVAAESERAARNAAARIKVEYEQLPGVFDPRDAMKKDAPLLYEEKGTNIQMPIRIRKGDTEKGFADSDVIIEGKFSTPFVEHSYLEPESAIAFIDKGGIMRLRGSFQNPFTARRAIASFLGIELNRVRIQKTVLGGTFGGKDEQMSAIGCRLALLALKTGRPVKATYSREDSFIESHKRNPFYMKYRLGATTGGIITAVEYDIVADSGAYCSMSPFVVNRGMVQGAGPYKIPNVKADAVSVYTNNPYTGAMRGFGSPQSHFAMESMMDMLAEKLDMDPLEIRLKNIIHRGDITATGHKITHDVGLEEALRTAAEAIGWKKKREDYAGQDKESHPKGVGIACCLRGVSLGAEGADASTASVVVQADGSVIVSTGITDHGQGSQTVLSQIVAEVLCISLDRIIYIEPDTSLIPDGGPTVASRGTIMGGNAAKNAAEKIVHRMKRVAAEMLKTDSEQVTVREGLFLDSRNSETCVTFDEVVAECSRQAVPLFEYGWYSAPKIHWDEEKGYGAPYFTYVYSVNACEVTVDTETGKVSVENFVSAHDMGRAINPMQCYGQMFGGAAMGIGFALLEELEVYEGKIKSLNFDTYTLPTACDLPELQGYIVERPDPDGPYGAKSLGEPATEVSAPAVINAVAHATGKRILDLPASLERVLLGKKLSKYGPKDAR
ncbi:MAG: xanthine dehydrogenase family protein molybdopterin-binding subunit [Elusimicrobiota bacterium]